MVKDFEEIKNFWNVLDPLSKNEVYVLLLIGKRGGKRNIIDTVLVKSNSFDEFFNKINVLLSKAKRLPFETELLMDVNKKNVVEGLENGWVDLRYKIQNDCDVRNFFSILLRNIRYAQVTNYNLIKDKEFLPEVEPEYVVKAGDIYYHIVCHDCLDCIHKPEIPIPGTFMNGETVRLYYVNDRRKRSWKRS